jgi:AAA domain
MPDLLFENDVGKPLWLPPGVYSPRVVSEKRAGLEVKRFADLADESPEPPWLWRGFLAPGLLTMLAGLPFAGKSMLVTGLLKAMEERDDFLGLPTTRSTALLVSEESESSLLDRASLFGVLNGESVYASRAQALRHDWDVLIRLATARALEGGHQLLVIDTFPGLAGLGDEQENDAGAVGARLRPLQQAAGEGLAVLFLHHMNDQKQPRGSKAFRGVVDISIRLLRNEGSRRVRLETLSRFPTATPLELKGELIKAADGWVYAAMDPITSKSKTVVAGSGPDESLRAALRGVAPGGATYQELARLPGLTENIAKKRLPAWYGKEPSLQRTGTGRKGDPYRWWISS